METGSSKTRNLSTYQYVKALQVEYVVAELRKKVYIKKKDKDFYKRVLDGKEKKIQDICLRNSLPSIFNDDNVKMECHNDVYRPFGYPDFHYRNEDQIQEFKVKDFYYYYYKDSEFRVNEDGEIKIGILKSVDQEKEVAFIKIKGEEKERPFTLDVVARII